MVRKILADESGFGTFTWALLIGAAAIVAVVYFPQLSFVTAALGQFWAWLTLPGSS